MNNNLTNDIDIDLDRVEEDRKHIREAEDLVKSEKQHLVDDLKKLEEDEHRKVEIIVNGEDKQWHKKEISYREVVILAYGVFEENDLITYAVDYSHGPGGHHEGILNKNQSVPIINKMRFRVKKANRS
jgi:hypothetical protein